MSFKALIEDHRSGSVTFLQIGKPQFVCLNDDDFIDYINYCWEFLDFAQNKLSVELSVYNDDDHEFIIRIGKEVARAHGVLELCHKFLSGKSNMPKKEKLEVYTTTRAHERR